LISVSGKSLPPRFLILNFLMKDGLFRVASMSEVITLSATFQTFYDQNFPSFAIATTIL